MVNQSKFKIVSAARFYWTDREHRDEDSFKVYEELLDKEL
jgi:hypothetical protein